MKRTLSALIVLVFAAGLAGAAVTELPVWEPAKTELVSVDLDRAEAFGAWLSQNAAEAATCEQPATDADEAATIFAGDPQRKGGGACGGTTCPVFQYCCNPSCNICVPYGWSCTQQSCN